MPLKIHATDYWDQVLQQSQDARTKQLNTPLAGATISSIFGDRLHPILHVTKLHRGIDFAGQEGRAVQASGHGVVLYAEERGDLGLTVAVDHGSFVSRYGHLKAAHVHAGQEVDVNTVLGELGQSGMVTGPHLHFEVIKDGEFLDPQRMLDQLPSDTPLLSLSERIDSLLTEQQKKGDAPIHANRIQSSPTVWKMASDIASQENISVYRVLAAIVGANPSAFKGGDINFRYADQPLTLPTQEQIALVDESSVVQIKQAMMKDEWQSAPN